MSYTTNVPQPTFSTKGFVAPTESAILTGVQADQVLAFGANINPGLTTPQGQLAQSTTAIIADANAQFLALANNVDPAYAQGRYQDAIGRIYYQTRIAGTPTTLQIACVGLSGVVIPTGALVADSLGNIYTCTSGGAIGNSGTVTLGFANQVLGPVAVPNSVSIYQTVFGWNTATVVSGVLGTNVETRAAFEARRQLSVASNSVNFLQSVYGAVLAVPGVSSALVIDNPSSVPTTYNGVTITANTVYVAVLGGDSTAVATAIWSKKPPGCGYTGNTTVNVYDTNPAYVPPYPLYQVTFQIPSPCNTNFAIFIVSTTLVPANAATLVQNAVYNQFIGLGTVAAPGVGAAVYSSSFYGAITALGPWAVISSLSIGSTFSPRASINASISGTTLTISSVISGSIGSGILSIFGFNVTPGTRILSGGGSTYTLNISQTVALEVMTVVAANNSGIAVNANQYSTLNLADIFVFVQ